MTEEEYKKKVIECAANSECTEVILNNDIRHAAILIEQMFKRARHDVKLLAASLDSALYSQVNVLNAMRDFLAKENTRLEIVTEKEIRSEDNKELLSILDECKDKVGRNVAQPWLSDQYKYNFLVSDNSTYRFERDKNKHEATVEFHNNKRASKLNEVFGKIYGLAKSSSEIGAG